MGYAAYFLIVADFIAFARREGIQTTCRGSAPGSIVTYTLGITPVDPILYQLPFERFLNPDRVTMPDIDVDFEDGRRDEVIAYVGRKYGQDHVAQIITFGTMLARAAIRDVGRVLGHSYGEVDRIAKAVPNQLGITLEEAIKTAPALREQVDADPAVKRITDFARHLEGVARNASTHAAGVVISREPLTELMPLQKATNSDSLMTQYEMHAIEALGLLKFDFLGLSNLTILRQAVDFVQEHRGITIDLDTIPLDDAKTFDLLASGETTGIFQLESAGMRRYIRELRPTSVHDLAAMVALYRPGPMDNIPAYIRRKHGQEPVTYLHPLLEPYLEKTYGIFVYQEDIMSAAVALGGFTGPEADTLGYAIRKKKSSVLRAQKERFVTQAAERGVDAGVIDAVFHAFEPFERYGFNKAHATCYGLIAYQTAYLKANHTVDYMTAVLTAFRASEEKVAAAVAECRRMGIEVLPPDIHASHLEFTVEGDAIRFGLLAVKNVGQGAIESIIAARAEGGPFRSLTDLCTRIDLRLANRKVLEALIKVGAMRAFGHPAQLLLGVDDAIASAQATQRDRITGQTSLFDLGAGDADVLERPLPAATEVPVRERLRWEKELLGLYLSEHPMGEVAEQVGRYVNAYSGDLKDEALDGQRVVIGGIVTGIRTVITKRQEAMAIATLEDLQGSIEVVVFPRLYETSRPTWRDGAILLVAGRVDHKGEEVSLLADLAADWDDASARGPEAFAREVAAGDRSGGRGRPATSCRCRSARAGPGTGGQRRRSTGHGLPPAGGRQRRAAAGRDAADPARRTDPGLSRAGRCRGGRRRCPRPPRGTVGAGRGPGQDHGRRHRRRPGRRRSGRDPARPVRERRRARPAGQRDGGASRPCCATGPARRASSSTCRHPAAARRCPWSCGAAWPTTPSCSPRSGAGWAMASSTCGWPAPDPGSGGRHRASGRGFDLHDARRPRAVAVARQRPALDVARFAVAHLGGQVRELEVGRDRATTTSLRSRRSHARSGRSGCPDPRSPASSSLRDRLVGGIGQEDAEALALVDLERHDDPGGGGGAGDDAIGPAHAISATAAAIARAAARLRPRIARSALAGEPADLLDRRQPLVELGPDRRDDVGVEHELAGDLVHGRRLLGGDRAAGRADREAGAEHVDPLLLGGDAREFPGHDVVLGASDGPCLELGHLGDEDGGRFIERAVGLQLALHDGGLLRADIEVGLRGAGEGVGGGGDEPRLLGGHLLQPRDDPADRGGLAGRGRCGGQRGLGLVGGLLVLGSGPEDPSKHGSPSRWMAPVTIPGPAAVAHECTSSDRLGP